MIKFPKILIVDDEPRLCQSMKTLLSSHNYEVETCLNGTDALGLLTTETFDLMLLDIFMDGMDGFQVIENKNNRQIDTPVIIMTGSSSTDEAVRALRMGAVDYLKKPFETRDMLNAVIYSLNQISLEKKHKIDASQLAQQRKIESLSLMAGSIAHHFNNQLGAVMGNLEMALDELPIEIPCRKNVVQAMIGAQKAAVVSRQMLIYHGGHAFGRYRSLDLSKACRHTLSLLKAAIPEGLNLMVNFPDSGPVVHADPIEIQRILTHLITNAWESVSGNHGTISLEIMTVDFADVPFEYAPADRPLKQIPHACLEVSDTGCGISPRDIERLFDPFFTTKFTGRGLGLAVVLGIVKAHGGCITVESEPGNGSIFRIYLPVSANNSSL